MRFLLRFAVVVSVVLPISLGQAFAENPLKDADSGVVLLYTEFGTKAWGTGTGFVVSNDGLVATNFHVVNGATKITVLKKKPNQEVEEYAARVVSQSSGLDIALLKVEGMKLQPLVLATKPPSKGDKVYAIGFPASANKNLSREKIGDGLVESTVTEGIVGRVFEGTWSQRNQSDVKIVQHSAAINKGNSGGPLLDVCGRVVGINTQSALGDVVLVSPKEAKVVQQQGIFFASSILELIPELRSKSVGIPESGDVETCASSTPNQGRGQVASMGGTLPYFVIGVGVLSIILVGFAIYFFTRRPQIISESYTHYIKRTKKDQPQDSVVKQDRTVVRLFCVTSAGVRTDIPLLDGKSYVIGRDPSTSQLVFDDPSVSRKHAQIRLKNGNVEIRDLGSTNGTYINLDRVGDSFRVITARDRVLVGKASLKFS